MSEFEETNRSKANNDNQKTKHSVTGTDRCRIIMLVDETGSMSSHKQVTISSFNEWLDTNRTKESDEDQFPRFTLVKFNTITKLQEFDSVETAPELTNNNYSPANMTALYDALGETLENYETEKNNIMVIITDGAENSSKKWTQKMVQNKIKLFTDEKGWIFHYLGANQDAWAVGQSIGISDKKFTNSYSADNDGFKHVFRQSAVQCQRYRSYQSQSIQGVQSQSLDELVVPSIEMRTGLIVNSDVNSGVKSGVKSGIKSGVKSNGLKRMTNYSNIGRGGHESRGGKGTPYTIPKPTKKSFNFYSEKEEIKTDRKADDKL